MNASGTNKSFLYAAKMRASKGDLHLSGAERLVGREQILPVSQSLLKRALNHANGNADAVHLKIEALDASAVLKVPSLSVTEVSAANTDAEGPAMTAAAMDAARIRIKSSFLNMSLLLVLYRPRALCLRKSGYMLLTPAKRPVSVRYGACFLFLYV